jgi:hypothetical protein
MWRAMAVIGALILGGCAAGAGGDAPVVGLRTEQTQRTMLGSAETLVPYTDVLTYPDSWVAMSRRRAGE